MSVPSRGFIRRLCIALAHHWEAERLFVILTAYLDESGTHGGDGGGNPASASLVMAAVMGNARQWQKFQAETDRLKAAYGFSVFHSKKFKDRDADFAGWDVQKRRGLVSELVDLIAESLMQGCVVTLDRAKFRSEYMGASLRNGIRLDTEYGLCFRTCIKYLTDDAVRRLRHHRKFSQIKLNIVLEHGARNSGDCERIFSQLKNAYKAKGIELLDTFTLAVKKECDPLLTADFLAHTIWSSQGDELRLKEWDTPSLPPQKTGLTLLGFDPGALSNLRAALDGAGPTKRDISSALLSVAYHSSPLDKVQAS